MHISKALIGGVAVVSMFGASLSACAKNPEQAVSTVQESTSSEPAAAAKKSDLGVEFKGLEDPQVQRYLEDSVYDQVLPLIDTDKYAVENVQATHVSQEYLDELAYNSRQSIYFGLTLAELNEAFDGQRYVFGVDAAGKTTVTSFEQYDDTTEKVLQNVAVGTGVILLSVTIASVAGSVGAPAISVIFATGAKSGTVAALADSAISGGIAAFVSAMEGDDPQRILKEAALEGSNAFKWRAFGGIIKSAATKAKVLHAATSGGLSLNEVARIQKESKYPLDLIRTFHRKETYTVFKNAGLRAQMVNGRTALVRQIDWKFKNAKGYTNLELARQGKAPIDPATGTPYELHHIGQTNNAPLAILTSSEHRFGENNKLLHPFPKDSGVDHGAEWAKQKTAFWKTLAAQVAGQ